MGSVIKKVVRTVLNGFATICILKKVTGFAFVIIPAALPKLVELLTLMIILIFVCLLAFNVILMIGTCVLPVENLVITLLLKLMFFLSVSPAYLQQLSLTGQVTHNISEAFATVKTNLINIQVFHTDRGNEFMNQLIDETLKHSILYVLKA